MPKQVIGQTLIQLTDDDDGQGARFVQPAAAAATDGPAAIAVAARHALRGGGDSIRAKPLYRPLN